MIDDTLFTVIGILFVVIAALIIATCIVERTTK